MEIAIIVGVAIVVFIIVCVLLAKFIILNKIICILGAILGFIVSELDGPILHALFFGLLFFIFALPVMGEDTRSTKTYLILGTLVEETVGDSSIKTFFSTLITIIVLAAIWYFLASVLGAFFLYVGRIASVIFAIGNVVGLIRHIRDAYF